MKHLLRWMNLLILATGIISVVAALEIAKGARLHELNFKHVKYNHLLDDAFRLSDFDTPSGRADVRQLLLEVREQPIACLREVNAAERLAMHAFGTAEALDICRRDIVVADQTLSALDELDRGAISREAFFKIMAANVHQFRENSMAFEPLVKETVRCILRISIIIIMLKGVGISLLGLRISKLISNQYQQVSVSKEQLTQENDALQRVNEAKSAFLANMSHEIRTPLNGILGVARVMRSREKDESRLYYLNILQSSGEALLAILNDVLDLSTVEAGAMQLEKRAFSPALIAAQVRDTVVAVAEQKGVALNLKVRPSAQGAFVGDPARVRQILINFVGNAVKFIEKGEISVRVAKRSDGWIKFTVIDTGPGVEAEHQADIFGRFQQADNSSTREHGGAGLGLAISAELVNLMGGEYGVRSTPGRGSAFWFAVPLPLAEDPAEQADSKTPARARANESANDENAKPAETDQQTVEDKPCVLICEDNAINRMVAEKQLECSGFETVSCENGQEALNLLERASFDLILMDIQMPVMSGDDAIRAIRASEAPYADIPIVVLTANAMKGDAEKYLSIGADGYFSKPADMDVLCEKLHALTPRGAEKKRGAAA